LLFFFSFSDVRVYFANKDKRMLELQFNR
jgi:hypothetical protein